MSDTKSATFDRRMLEALVCPQTQGTLEYNAETQELLSKAANLAFPMAFPSCWWMRPAP